MNQRALIIMKRLAFVAGLVLMVMWPPFMAEHATEQARQKADAWAQKDKPGILVRLYDNPFLTGKPLDSIRSTPDYHAKNLDKSLLVRPASWRWLARLEAPESGEYLIDIFAAEAVRLFIDGKPVIEHWAPGAPQSFKAMVKLEKGSHLWDLRNVQTPGQVVLSFSWAPPGAAQVELIPSDAFTPLDPRKADNQALWQVTQAQRKWRGLIWLLPVLWLLMWITVLARPMRLLAVLREHWLLALIICMAGFLRLFLGDIVPGVSGESAYFLRRAELISQGALPFNGMVSRTGPFLDYLLALPVMVFGPSPWLLRAVCGLFNTLAVLFCYRAFLREAGKKSALTAALMLAVLPGVVIFSRNPVDYTTLGPLLFFMGLDCLSLSRKKPPFAILGGMLWGIGIFNHSIFVVFPATLGLAGLVVSRLKVLKHHLYWGCGLGMLLTMAPRLIERMVNHHTTPMSFFKLERFLELGGFADILIRTIDGQVIFQLYTGQYSWAVFGVIPAVLLLSCIILGWGLFKRRDDHSWLDAVLMLSIIVFILMAPVGAPTANPRYFAYCVILAALVLGRGWARAWQWSPLPWRKLTACGLGLFTAFCLASLGINYFHAHYKTGGLPLAWKNRLLDHVSDAWMNHSEMSDYLVKKGYPVIATADRWHHTLNLALDLYQGRPRTFMATPIQSRSATERAAVFYNSPEGRRTLSRYLRGNPLKEFKRVKLPPHLAKKYILLKRVDNQVSHPKAMEEIR